MAPVFSCNWDDQGLFQNSECQIISVLGLLLVTLEMIAGMVQGFFIMFSIYKDFHQKKYLSTRNKILLAISFSSVLYILLMSMRIIVKIFTSTPSFYIYLYALSQYICIACCCFTSVLCLFYFIKIGNFQSRCLTLMKKKIDTAMTWIILLVEVLSFCSIFLPIVFYVSPVESSMNSSTVSSIDEIHKYVISCNFFQVSYFIILVPYLTMIVTTAFTMVSLKHHIHNLARSLGSSCCTQLKAHQEVVKTLKHLLIFYMTFFFAVTIVILDLPKLSLGDIINFMTVLLFYPLQLSLIINGDPKLKEKWVSEYVRCRRKLHSLLH